MTASISPHKGKLLGHVLEGEEPITHLSENFEGI